MAPFKASAQCRWLASAVLLLACRVSASAQEIDPPYEHPEVYAWYFGTIDTAASSIGQGASTVIINDTGIWYEDRAQQGYYHSRNGGWASHPSDGGSRITPAYTADLVYNGDFEVGVDGSNPICWAGWHYHGGQGARTWQVEGGNHFARLSGTEDDVLIHNRFYIDSGMSQLRFEARVNSTGINFDVHLLDDDGSEHMLLGMGLLQADWGTYTLNLPTGVPGGSYRLRFETSPGQGNGSIDIDDIELLSSSKGSGPSPARNAIPARKGTATIWRTTVITHGYTIMGPSGETTLYADWMVPMAQAIRDRVGYGTVLEYQPATGAWSAVGNIQPGELVMVFDWKQESDLPNLGGTKGFAEGAADALYAALRDAQLPGLLANTKPLNNDLHFIGHSRGTVVNSETVERIVQAGFDVEHVTTLDPHPVNGRIPPTDFDFADPEPETWEGVIWADNYWREDDNDLDFNGFDLPGTYSVDLGPAIETTPIPVDWGDAPDDEVTPRYPTLASHNGANHVVGGPWFGILAAFPDGEPDGQPHRNALGDDNAAWDDEDGVTVPSLVRGWTAPVRIDVRVGGVVEGWIDWNRDDAWAHPGERVVSVQLAPGVHVVNVPVPTNAVLGNTFARFRISTAGGLPPTGPAPDGEVEDYWVEVLSPGTRVSDAPTHGFRLLQNTPNPFNPRTVIPFELPVRGAVTIRVHDSAGRVVRILVDGIVFDAGRQKVIWDGRSDDGRVVAAGVYLYELTSGDFVATRRLVFLK